MTWSLIKKCVGTFLTVDYRKYANNKFSYS